MQEQDLKHAAHRSALLSEALQELLGTEAVVDRKGCFAMAYLSLSLDHREVILLLVGCGAFASGTALQRPLLEAFVTGAWIDSSATEQELPASLPLADRHPRLNGWYSDFVKRTHSANGVKFYGGTMTFFVIIRMETGASYRVGLAPNAVEPRYSIAQIVETLRYVHMVGLMAAIHREKGAGRSITQLLQMLESLLHGRPKVLVPTQSPLVISWKSEMMGNYCTMTATDSSCDGRSDHVAGLHRRTSRKNHYFRVLEVEDGATGQVKTAPQPTVTAIAQPAVELTSQNGNGAIANDIDGSPNAKPNRSKHSCLRAHADALQDLQRHGHA